MPWLGFGTYKAKKARVEAPLRVALQQAGMTMLDTAFVYHNEEQIGATLALLEGEGIARPFVVTKLWRSHVRPSEVSERLDDHVRKLGGPVDLWLMHWPGPGRSKKASREAIPADWTPAMRVQCFRAMTQCLGERVRAVGVSNFTLAQLQGCWERVLFV